MIDYSESGIEDSYEFIQCDNRTLEEIGPLTGVKVGAKINAAYNGELRFGGSIELDGSDYVDNRLIRIYHTATLGDESDRRCLGTYFVGNDDLTYSYGRYSGSVDLWSTLKRYTDAKVQGAWWFTQGHSALSSFYQLMQAEGGIGVSGVSDKLWSSSSVIDFGKPLLDVLNAIAEFLDAQAIPDDKGRVVLSPYVLPANKPISYTVPTGDKSITYVGLDISDGKDDVPSRYGIRYQHDDTSIVGIATLPASSPYSFAQRGRNVDVCDTVDQLSPETVAQATAIAATRLDSAAKPNCSYTFRSYYMPYRIGEVITVPYKDSADGGILIDGLVTSIDYTCGIALEQETTVAEVRRYTR